MPETTVMNAMDVSHRKSIPNRTPGSSINAKKKKAAFEESNTENGEERSSRGLFLLKNKEKKEKESFPSDGAGSVLRLRETADIKF